PALAARRSPLSAGRRACSRRLRSCVRAAVLRGSVSCAGLDFDFDLATPDGHTCPFCSWISATASAEGWSGSRLACALVLKRRSVSCQAGLQLPSASCSLPPQPTRNSSLWRLRTKSAGGDVSGILVSFGGPSRASVVGAGVVADLGAPGGGS